jgi:tetratricopeptide (TPR) repeat protein
MSPSYSAPGGLALRVRPGFWVGLLLVLAVAAVYWQAGRFEFVDFDDPLYITANPHVASGLTRSSVAWSLSFEEKEKTYWHPLTWLSHMLDVELFGLNPGPHHLMNVMLHLCNALLLFAFLTRLTGAPWLSGMVAALFAVHPVNVESVAWVAERKNVLSTLFWFLSLHAYIHYAHRRGRVRYAALIAIFTLGLMAKPMMVTLPCVMLLLDFWPLGSLSFGRAGDPSSASRPPVSALAGVRIRWELVWEKIPMLFLALLASYLTTDSLKFAGSTIPFSLVPLSLRLQNALVSFLSYSGMILFPSHLAVFYPYPTTISLGRTVAAAVILAGVTGYAVLEMRKRPYLLVGWLWFLGTLAPVCGIVQVGLWPAKADRWAYIPAIGLFIIVVWSGNEYVQRWRWRGARCGACALALAIIAGLTLSAHHQAGVWRNGVALFEYAVANTKDNSVAHGNLGGVLYAKGRIAEARFHFEEALRIDPDYYLPYYNIGIDYARLGKFEEAAKWYRKCLALNPQFAPAHKNMAAVQLTMGKGGQALKHYMIALENEPEDKTIHNDVGCALMRMGQPARAILFFQNALRLDPRYAEAHNNIGAAYAAIGRRDDAARHLHMALAIKPGYPEALKNLKDALALKTE